MDPVCGSIYGVIHRSESSKEIDGKGNPLGTPNREPQEYSRNIMEYKDPGRYIPIIYLLYSRGSLFGVPSRVPLDGECMTAELPSISTKLRT